MAVEFISNGYDTTPTNPYTEEAWATAHPSIGLATYGVRSAGDWKVTAVSGQDRTVSIAAGWGWGNGITDLTFANDTIQLDTIAAGSRWDLIAVRRDWTPTAGVSKFVKVNGGATAVIPGGRQSNPGGIDDQPLALVQVTAGQTQPTGFIDLRTWSGDGGGFIANHDLVRTFQNKVGTRLWVNGVDWIRKIGDNDAPEWLKIADANAFPDVPWTALPLSWGFAPFASAGWSGLRYAVRNGWFIVDGAVRRDTAWPNETTCAVVPAPYKPAVKIQGVVCAVEPSVGNIILPAGSNTTSFSATWPLF